MTEPSPTAVALEAAAVMNYGTREQRIAWLLRRGWTKAKTGLDNEFTKPDGVTMRLDAATVRQELDDLAPFRHLAAGTPVATAPPPATRELTETQPGPKPAGPRGPTTPAGEPPPGVAAAVGLFGGKPRKKRVKPE